MSALDLDALEQRCKDTIAEWTLVYVQSGETLPDDAVETKAARETLALITRLRAAESERDDLRRSLAMLAVIVRDDFNHSVLVTVPLPAAPEAP